MKKLSILFLLACAFALCSAKPAAAQTSPPCVPGGGVQCTPTLGLWLPPFSYPNWNIPVNANFSRIDALVSSNYPFVGWVVIAGASAPTLPCSSSSNAGVLAINATPVTYQCSNATGAYQWNL